MILITALYSDKNEKQFYKNENGLWIIMMESWAVIKMSLENKVWKILSVCCLNCMYIISNTLYFISYTLNWMRYCFLWH